MTAFQAFAEAPSAGQLGHLSGSSNGFLGRTQVRALDAASNCGLAVCNGATAGKTVKVPTTKAEAAACLGILLDPVYLNEIGTATDYTIGQPCTILEEGEMWVNAELTVAVDDPVYVRHTSDGGSNTTRGTLRNDADGTVVIDTTANAVEGIYAIVLSNGLVEETFVYATDGSATTAEILAGLVALIEASANFNAAGTTEITVTRVTGTEIKVVELRAPTPATQALWTITDNQKAAKLPGARWVKARTGAGLTKVRLQRQPA
jgi:hypothetical protein